MRHQMSCLVLLMMVAYCAATTLKPIPDMIDDKENEIDTKDEFKRDPKIPMSQDPR